MVERPAVLVSSLFCGKTAGGIETYYSDCARFVSITTMLKRPVSQDKPHSAMDIMWAVKTGVAADVNLAGDLFWPIISLSRIFGHCPLSYKATTKSSSLPKPSKSVCISREYETLGWRSWWLLWSVISSMFFISLWTLFVVECFTDFRLHSEQG